MSVSNLHKKYNKQTMSCSLGVKSHNDKYIDIPVECQYVDCPKN